jgi:hypothetical protein
MSVFIRQTNDLRDLGSSEVSFLHHFRIIANKRVFLTGFEFLSQLQKEFGFHLFERNIRFSFGFRVKKKALVIVTTMDNEMPFDLGVFAVDVRIVEFA